MKDITKTGSRGFACVRLILLMAIAGFVYLILTETSVSTEFTAQTTLLPAERQLEESEFVHFTPPPTLTPDLDDTGVNSIEVLTNVSRIFYNRVPKCGSRTILRILEKLSEKNEIHNYHSEIYNVKQLTEEGEVRFVQEFMEHDPPLLYDRHLYFVDFKKHGHEPPLYINLIRDPFERILSRHYYILYESRNTPKETKDEFNMTFTECVKQNKTICMSPSNLIELVRYFCGQDPVCESKGGANNAAILRKAKTHVIKHFPVVGVIEDAESFFFLLEKRLPTFFGGALEIYQHIISKMKVRYRNSQKIMPDNATKDYVISKMSEAYDFYNFVRQRQHNMMTAFQLGKS
ncbi:hypothetical protein CAPTEDRAFT_229374 [Capitella teleta]|uniref:Sulfotransferase domain-containing protein n=1 Tax=Capitella teleta TaxID=283909 RepID=R7UTZ4_CAPTE|nr:hypothetical protein CAPTEDRAFT_229374 [Capitella teleta]|eukprot:ELU09608.1 hypothetical protein CAPTEDRAFT_229374 [Capitella teleta]